MIAGLIVGSAPVASKVQNSRNDLTHAHVFNGLDQGDIVYLVPPDGAHVPDFPSVAPADNSGTRVRPRRQRTVPANSTPTSQLPIDGKVLILT